MCRLISELGIVKQAHPSFMFFSITSSEKFRFLSLILNVFNIDLHIGALPFFLFCLVANNYRSNCAILYSNIKIGLMIFSHQSIYYKPFIYNTPYCWLAFLGTASACSLQLVLFLKSLAKILCVYM